MTQPLIAYYLVTIFASCGFLWAALRRTKVEKSIILFVLFILLTLFWQITLFLFYLINDPVAVLWLGRLNFAVIATAIIFLFYFSLAFHNDRKISAWVYVFSGVETAALVVITMVTGLIDEREIIEGAHRLTEYGDWYYWFVFHFLGYIVFSMIILAARSRKLASRARVQVKYLLAGILLAATVGAVTNIFVPLISQNYYVQNFGVGAAFLLVGFSTYAMMRHSLFNSKIIVTEMLVVMLMIIGLVQLITAPNLGFFAMYLLILIILVVVGLSLMRGVLREHESALRIKELNEDLVASNERLKELTRNLKEANGHLKELMDIKTEFLHIASHQLRTPLTSLRGLLEMQAQGDFEKLTEEKKKEIRGNMLAGANHLNNIVNDLLDAMELEGGNLNFKMEKFQIAGLVEEVARALKYNYDKKSLTLTIEKSKKPLPEIEGDIDYLRQVFLNILDNAEKYTRKGGVTISFVEKKSHVEVLVKDTGIGIDPEEKDGLFGKFVRGRRSQGIHTDGSGLGLFIIKKIVEEHHGKVTLESEGIGKGTAFHVILPLRQ